ncbi:hypothetical protein CSUI_008584, partial [Cystoisospora suis]
MREEEDEEEEEGVKEVDRALEGLSVPSFSLNHPAPFHGSDGDQLSFSFDQANDEENKKCFSSPNGNACHLNSSSTTSSSFSSSRPGTSFSSLGGMDRTHSSSLHSGGTSSSFGSSSSSSCVLPDQQSSSHLLSYEASHLPSISETSRFRHSDPSSPSSSTPGPARSSSSYLSSTSSSTSSSYPAPPLFESLSLSLTQPPPGLPSPPSRRTGDKERERRLSLSITHGDREKQAAQESDPQSHSSSYLHTDLPFSSSSAARICGSDTTHYPSSSSSPAPLPECSSSPCSPSSPRLYQQYPHAAAHPHLSTLPSSSSSSSPCSPPGLSNRLESHTPSYIPPSLSREGERFSSSSSSSSVFPSFHEEGSFSSSYAGRGPPDLHERNSYRESFHGGDHRDDEDNPPRLLDCMTAGDRGGEGMRFSPTQEEEEERRRRTREEGKRTEEEEGTGEDLLLRFRDVEQVLHQYQMKEALQALQEQKEREEMEHFFSQLLLGVDTPEKSNFLPTITNPPHHPIDSVEELFSQRLFGNDPPTGGGSLSSSSYPPRSNGDDPSTATTTTTHYLHSHSRDYMLSGNSPGSLYLPPSSSSSSSSYLGDQVGASAGLDREGEHVDNRFSRECMHTGGRHPTDSHYSGPNSSSSCASYRSIDTTRNLSASRLPGNERGGESGVDDGRLLLQQSLLSRHLDNRYTPCMQSEGKTVKVNRSSNSANERGLWNLQRTPEGERGGGGGRRREEEEGQLQGEISYSYATGEEALRLHSDHAHGSDALCPSSHEEEGEAASSQMIQTRRRRRRKEVKMVDSSCSSSGTSLEQDQYDFLHNKLLLFQLYLQKEQYLHHTTQKPTATTSHSISSLPLPTSLPSSSSLDSSQYDYLLSSSSRSVDQQNASFSSSSPPPSHPRTMSSSSERGSGPNAVPSSSSSFSSPLGTMDLYSLVEHLKTAIATAVNSGGGEGEIGRTGEGGEGGREQAFQNDKKFVTPRKSPLSSMHDHPNPTNPSSASSGLHTYHDLHRQTRPLSFSSSSSPSAALGVHQQEKKTSHHLSSSSSSTGNDHASSSSSSPSSSSFLRPSSSSSCSSAGSSSSSIAFDDSTLALALLLQELQMEGDREERASQEREEERHRHAHGGGGIESEGRREERFGRRGEERKEKEEEREREDEGRGRRMRESNQGGQGLRMMRVDEQRKEERRSYKEPRPPCDNTLSVGHEEARLQSVLSRERKDERGKEKRSPHHVLSSFDGRRGEKQEEKEEREEGEGRGELSSSLFATSQGDVLHFHPNLRQKNVIDSRRGRVEREEKGREEVGEGEEDEDEEEEKKEEKNEEEVNVEEGEIKNNKIKKKTAGRKKRNETRGRRKKSTQSDMLLSPLEGGGDAEEEDEVIPPSAKSYSQLLHSPKPMMSENLVDGDKADGKEEKGGETKKTKKKRNSCGGRSPFILTNEQDTSPSRLLALNEEGQLKVSITSQDLPHRHPTHHPPPPPSSLSQNVRCISSSPSSPSVDSEGVQSRKREREQPSDQHTIDSYQASHSASVSSFSSSSSMRKGHSQLQSLQMPHSSVTYNISSSSSPYLPPPPLSSSSPCPPPPRSSSPCPPPPTSSTSFPSSFIRPPSPPPPP